MKTLDERIYELEKRVSNLEKKLSIERKMPIVTAPKRYKKGFPSEVIRPEERSIDMKLEKESNKKYDFAETIVGKYIIGSLASLLVFIGAISLVILLWDKVTPQLKLTMLVVVSLLITASGYFRILKEKNHINSIILGTGAGLLFISILSSYIYFGYISSNIAFLLVGLWSILFIFSYKYTRTYFTSIIAYIGSYIATILGLSLILVTIQLNVILMFVTSISLTLLISGYRWLSKKHQLINLSLSLLSYMTVFLWIWVQTEFSTIQINYMYYIIILSVIIYAITNIANIIIAELVETNKDYKMVSIIINIIIGIVVGACFISVLGDVGRYIFVILSLTQILFNEFKIKNITKFLTIINGIFIALVITEGTHSVVSGVIGLIMLMIFLMIIEKEKSINHYEKLRIGLIILSMYQLIENLNIDKVNIFIYFVTIVVLILVVAKMLIDKYKLENKKNIVIFKTLGYLLVIQTIIAFVSESIYRINDGFTEILIYSSPILYVLITITIVTTLKLGYFKDWFNSDFKWFEKNPNIKEDHSYILFFVATSFMYIIGLFMIIGQPEGYNIILILLATIAIMIAQSIEFFKIRDKSEFIGVLEGLKYLIYIWIVMVSLLNFEISSLSTSIVGLMIALISITLGFNKEMKGLRLYGLVVTLIMVFKVITIDMGGQNSITRVVSLIIGGLICFVISIVYNKIDKSIED